MRIRVSSLSLAGGGVFCIFGSKFEAVLNFPLPTALLFLFSKDQLAAEVVMVAI